MTGVPREERISLPFFETFIHPEDRDWVMDAVRALKTLACLSAGHGNALIARLNRVRVISHDFGYGIVNAMDSLLAQYVGE